MNKQWSLELHHFPAELRLLLDIMKSRPAALETADLTSGRLDWQEFAALAMHHRVYPSIHEQCTREGSLLPGSMIQWLNQKYHRNTFTMLQLSGQMQQLSQQLTDHGITALQLKGPVLAQLLYGDLSRRTSKDLDVLVPLQQLDQAEQVLQQLGYIKTQEIDRTTGRWKWRHNHESYIHERTGVEVELHWRLNGDSGLEQKFAELWDRRQTLEFGGTAVHMMGNEDLLIYLSVHGARHAWFRLRWLVDIDKLLQTELNWPLLKQLSGQYKCDHIIGQAIVLSEAMMQTPVHPEMKYWTERPRAHELAKRVLVFIREKVSLCPEPETEVLAKQYRSYQYALKTSSQKLLFWARKLAPDDWDMQTLPLPKKLYFLYYPLHPFLLLYRQIQRRTALQREVGQ